jgi:5'-nucleotidase
MLTIAVSSRALFRMDKSHDVFLEGGPAAFEKFQRENENVALEPGVAFPLVKKLLALNSPGKRDRVEVVLLSRNSPDAGMRVMRSISDYNLDIERAIFTQGLDRFRWARALKTDLFLSANSDDVRTALENGVAAAAMLPHGEAGESVGDVKIAFDGDSVLFSDAAERVYQAQGLAAFQQTEQEQAAVPLPDGPFRGLLTALSTLQKEYPVGQAPIKIALVTARGIPAQERVLKTLRSWSINIDVAAFCGGLPKGPFLEAFEADIFFDDTMKHCESAASSRIPAGHVVHGIANEVRTTGAEATAAA